MIIKRLTLAAAGLAGALTLASCGGDGGSSPSDVIATVNGTDVTAAEVEVQYEILAQSAGAAGETPAPDEEPDPQQRVDGLNQLVFAQILLDNAAEMGVEVSEEDIQATLDGLVVQFGGEEEFYNTLAEQGMDRDEVDRQLELATTQEEVVAELSEDVTDEEIQTSYDEGASVRHILVEDEAAANNALDRLDSGETFADVASDVSTDQQSAENGGELGFTQPGMFVPEFEEALFSADEGETVGPVETQYGFHIIERMPTPAIDEVRDQIRTQLEQTRSNEAAQEFNELMQGWLEDAEVTIHDAEYGVWDAEGGGVVLEQADSGDDSSTEAPDSDTSDSGSGDGGDSGEDTSGE